MSSNTHQFTVTVSGCDAEQADQVMNERISPDEDYGFYYQIGFKANAASASPIPAGQTPAEAAFEAARDVYFEAWRTMLYAGITRIEELLAAAEVYVATLGWADEDFSVVEFVDRSGRCAEDVLEMDLFDELYSQVTEIVGSWGITQYEDIKGYLPRTDGWLFFIAATSDEPDPMTSVRDFLNARAAQDLINAQGVQS